MENGQEPGISGMESTAQFTPQEVPFEDAALELAGPLHPSPTPQPHMITAHLQFFSFLLVLIPNW